LFVCQLFNNRTEWNPGVACSECATQVDSRRTATVETSKVDERTTKATRFLRFYAFSVVLLQTCIASALHLDIVFQAPSLNSFFVVRWWSLGFVCAIPLNELLVNMADPRSISTSSKPVAMSFVNCAVEIAQIWRQGVAPLSVRNKFSLCFCSGSFSSFFQHVGRSFSVEYPGTD